MQEIDKVGTIRYYNDDMLHNKNGPTIIHPSGMVEYFQNGTRHRLDGPAVICDDGEVTYWIEYWIDGIQYSIQEFKLITFFNVCK